MQNTKQRIITKAFLNGFYHFKPNRWIIASSFLLFTGIYFIFLRTNDVNVFSKKENFKIDFYTDSAIGGNSQIKQHLVSDSLIDFSFYLKKGFLSPYVGINLSSRNDNTLDLSAFNQLQFELKGIDLKNIIVVMVTRNNDKDISVTNNELIFTGNVEVTANKTRYLLNMNQMKVPDWWFVVNKLSPNKVLLPDFQHVIRINIATGATSAEETERSLLIYSFSFIRNNTTLLLLLGLLQVLIIIVLLGLHYNKTRSKKKTESITVNYKPINIDSENIHLHRYLEYINNNFHDASLSLENVSAQTGINQRRIANSILNQFGCNFKTYINQIRINEAKRLLAESDLNIGEIAFKVGFNSQNHFNRVFKSIVGINPSEYRDTKL